MTIALTPEQFTTSCNKLKTTHGITIDPTQTSGTISADGAVVNWSYDGANLTLNIVKKPFFISTAKAEQMIGEFFQGA